MKNWVKIITIWVLKAIFVFVRKQELILKKIIVVAPHPDDEIQGLGGLIIKLLKQGTRICIVYLTDGENSGVWGDKETIRSQRINLSEQVCAILGIDSSSIVRMHMSDGAVAMPGQPGYDHITASLVELMDRIQPDAVFSTHPSDYWPYDHVACSRLVYDAAVRTSAKPKLWYYWVWTWYNIKPWDIFRPGFFNLRKVEIEDQLRLKKSLLDIYYNSYAPNGKPWSGVLPLPLIKAFSFDIEIIEEIL